VSTKSLKEKMMKKILVAYTLIIAAPFILANCGKSDNKDSEPKDQPAQNAQSNPPAFDPNNANNNTIKPEGTAKMTRTKTASGLEYITEHEGTGDTPQKGKSVTVHYTGWLDKNGEPDSQSFDSSYSRNQPFTFTIGIGQVIRGWDEGVMDMKVGEKRRLFIPSDLGYGAHGAGRVIPPHAKLIFDVELLKVS